MAERVLEYRAGRDGTRQGLGAAVRTVLRALVTDYTVLILTAAYFLAVVAIDPRLASERNLRDMLFTTVLPLLAVAVGQTLVVITGGIDLSVGSVISLASVAGAMVMSDPTGLLAGRPVAVPAALATMLAAGAAVGLFNGAAVTLLRMPPFIVTLTTMMFVRGLAIWLTGSANVAGLPDAFLQIHRGSLSVRGLDVPNAVLIVGVLTLLAHALLRATLAGRWLYAVGSNPKAAEISGVPVRRTVILAYVASGACAAVAGALFTADMGAARPTEGDTKLLDVIGAVVIGGTSLFGGKGGVPKTVFGVLFFAVISKSLDWFSLGHEVTALVKGGVILLAAALDLLQNKVLAKG